MHRRAARRRRTHGADFGHSCVGRDQVVEVLRKLDVPAVEQVIAVPLISSDRVDQRSAFVVRRRQSSWWKCRRSPNIHWRSLPCVPWGGGLQRHWRSRSWTIQFLRVGEGETEVLKVLSQDEQIVAIPARGGLQGFLPGQGSSSRPISSR